MRLAKYKGLIGLAVGIGLYALFLQLSGIHCPIKYLIGISCPGCGMTRALLAALRLDFSAAFGYNPAWCALIVCAVCALVLWFKRKRRGAKITVAVFFAVLVTVYAVRMIAGGSDVTVIEPQNGLIYRLFREIFRK